MNVAKEIETDLKGSLDYTIPDFKVGDTVKVHQKIVEGNKERIQVFEGVVIARNNKGAGKSFTVRRISYDVGVERVFPLYSPRIAQIEIVRRGKVRRSKLYYLREKIGKSGRIKEKKGAWKELLKPESSVPVKKESPKEEAVEQAAVVDNSVEPSQTDTENIEAKEAQE